MAVTVSVCRRGGTKNKLLLLNIDVDVFPEDDGDRAQPQPAAGDDPHDGPADAEPRGHAGRDEHPSEDVS